MPMIFLGDNAVADYKGHAPHCLSRAETMSDSEFPPQTLMFCPQIATALKWMPDLYDPMTYR